MSTALQPLEVAPSAKSLLVDAILWMRPLPKQWGRPVLVIMFTLADRLVLGEARVSQADLAQAVGLSPRGHRLRELLGVICRRPGQPREPQHVFVRMVETWKGGRKATCYALDTGFKSEVLQAKKSAKRPPRRPKGWVVVTHEVVYPESGGVPAKEMSDGVPNGVSSEDRGHAEAEAGVADDGRAR